MIATYFATSPRRFRLDSDCSQTSEGSVESVFSYQNAETDHVQDSFESQDEYQIDFDDEDGVVEYEPRSSDDDEDVKNNDKNGAEMSSSESEAERMRVALSASVCQSPKKDFWLTEAEDSESDKSIVFAGQLDNSPIARDFLTCVECHSTNHHPRYKYCDSCYQVRKKWFGPSRFKKRKRHRRAIKRVQVIARRLMDNLKDVAHDSGQGSSQEPQFFEVRHVGELRVPKLHDLPGTSQSRPEEQQETTGSEMNIRKRKTSNANSDSGVSDSSEAKRPRLTDVVAAESDVVATSRNDDGTISVPLSDVLAAKALLDANKGASICATSSSDTASLCASQTDAASFTASQSDTLSIGTSQSDAASSSLSSVTTWRHRDAVSALWNGDDVDDSTPYPPSESSRANPRYPSIASPSDDDNDLCIICQEAPVEAIFLHPNVGHVCSCYRCGKEVLKRTKRCPVCNLPSYKVIRYYKS